MTEPDNQPTMWQRSTTRRVLAWLFSWRGVRTILFVVVGLTSVIALFYSIEDWRGKHAWERYRQQREALGDKFAWSALVPPPVPDDENLAAAPVFAELFPKPPPHPRLGSLVLPACMHAAGNWHESRRENLQAWRSCLTNENLLSELSTYGPLLHEITEAGRRPRSRFPIRYEDGYNTLLPHLNYLRAPSRVFRLRALAELSENQTDAALEDIRTTVRLADSIREEPMLISFLVRIAVLDSSIQPVWEGLADHRWREEQLKSLQALFQKTDQFHSFTLALQGERILAYKTIQELTDMPFRQRVLNVSVLFNSFDMQMNVLKPVLVAGPKGWLYQNQLALDRSYTETFLPAIGWDQRCIKPERVNEAVRQVEMATATRFNALSKMLMSAVPRVAIRAAQSQTDIDLAALACALERYRLANGSVPESLDQLIPTYINALPHDIINGQPLRYRRGSSDTYVLYSVGWNNTDDGGVIAITKDKKPRQDYGQGDWVWQYP